MKIVLPGRAEGRVLKLPCLSLWGGVDPFTGRLVDPALPHFNELVKDRVLMVDEPIGSSSSSAVLLELLYRGLAPAAIVLGRVDAIIGLGILTAREMGWRTIPLVVMAPPDQSQVADGQMLGIPAD